MVNRKYRVGKEIDPPKYYKTPPSPYARRPLERYTEHHQAHMLEHIQKYIESNAVHLT
jgi:hypothetical protein